MMKLFANALCTLGQSRLGKTFEKIKNAVKWCFHPDLLTFVF